MNLVEVNPSAMAHLQILFKLLTERTAWQSISHKKMPTFGEHMRFVKSKPYQAWFILVEGEEPLGSTYLSHNNELGIFIFKAHHGKGYGKQAIEAIMAAYDGPFYANISPHNMDSQIFFKKLGFKFIQMTYVLGEEDAE
jgi:RimJ/RimL family protein N-acetyltransferase